MPSSFGPDGIQLEPARLAMILSDIDLNSARHRKRFR